jgi:O-antigen ligase
MKDRKSEFGLVIGGTIVVVFTLAVVTNVSIPLFGSRTISAEQLITNVTSTVDPSAGSSRESSTTAWRLDIWGRVLDDVAQDSPIMGFGPGPDIGEIYGIGGRGEETLRNPHNSHVGILARMGFVGIVMWAVLWTVWAIQLLLLRQRLLARGRKSEAAVAAWLVVAAVVILLNAIFDPTLEGPQVAVWLWAFFGLGAALPLLYSGFESAWLDEVPIVLQTSAID